MTDLLVQRLKAAKRELTALKTAHRRGLGLLKIYAEDAEIEEQQTGLWNIIITITFATNSTPYPFAYIEPQRAEDGSNPNLLDYDGWEYADNGKKFIAHMSWVNRDIKTANFRIVASSPFTYIIELEPLT